MNDSVSPHKHLHTHHRHALSNRKIQSCGGTTSQSLDADLTIVLWYVTAVSALSSALISDLTDVNRKQYRLSRSAALGDLFVLPD